MDPQTKVSAIVPTRNRHSLLSRILAIYDQQDWGNKELLILDDSDHANTQFLKEVEGREDVRYWHQLGHLSIGAKRNALIEQSSGQIIAHFDDDDYYSPSYLSSMLKLMSENDSDFVKLTGWFCLHEATGKLGYWDTTDTTTKHTTFGGPDPVSTKKESFTPQAYRSFMTGYGFSYMYQKACWDDIKFPNQNVGEDTIFLESLYQRRKKIKLVTDASGLCLHIIHSYNSSKCFPNYILPSFCLSHYFKDYKPERANSIAKASPHANDLPLVTICTLTHNRPNFLRLLQTCIESQDYPLEKIEWLIIDDSSTSSIVPTIKTETRLNIKHQRLLQKVTLGAKRNLSHTLCSGDIIVYMDDDDFYPPTRVSHAVNKLLSSNCMIAGSTLLPIYFTQDQQLWVAGPYGKNHATANTFAMKKEFTWTHFYNNNATCAEEKAFLNDYSVPLVQLNPLETVVCISHASNTFDKMRLRTNNNPRMKRADHIMSDSLAKILQSYIQPGQEIPGKLLEPPRA